jgi:hypothetical protein
MERMIFVSLCLFSTLLFSQQEKALDNVSAVQEIIIFPNPATTVVNVLGLKNAPQASIVLSDMYGNTQNSYQWEIKNNALNIPVANLEPGIYLLSIRSPEQKVQKKFVKQ